jgi:hypothetical protein
MMAYDMRQARRAARRAERTQQQQQQQQDYGYGDAMRQQYGQQQPTMQQQQQQQQQQQPVQYDYRNPDIKRILLTKDASNRSIKGASKNKRDTYS